MKGKKFSAQIRSIVTVIWVSFACLAYAYYYGQALWHNFPGLQQIRAGGLIEMMRRYFTP